MLATIVILSFVCVFLLYRLRQIVSRYDEMERDYKTHILGGRVKAQCKNRKPPPAPPPNTGSIVKLPIF